MSEPFGEYFLHPNQEVSTRASKRLFDEAATFYLAAMSRRHLLSPDDKDILLTGIYHLIRLGDCPRARALIRMCFAELSAEETLLWIERARQAALDSTTVIPF